MRVVTLITAHNCDQFIEPAVGSAAEQSDHVIVHDDASTDRTPEILARAVGPITIVRADENIGPQRARNKLIDLALEGGWDYVQFLDGDDMLLPGKLETQIASGRLVSYTNFLSQIWKDNAKPDLIKSETGKLDLLVSLLAHEYNPATGCWLIHRSVLEQVRWDESYSFMCDRKLALDLLKAGFAPQHIDHDGYIYRRNWSPDQLTRQPEAIKNENRRRFFDNAFGWVDAIAKQTYSRIEASNP